MKIVHLCAENLQVFEDALEGTGCKICGARNPKDVRRALSHYNARDVMGLIVYKQHLTRRLLDLIHFFDELFVFDPKPVLLVCDDAEELCTDRIVTTKNSPLFALNSVDGTISDIDLCRIFTTLSCLSSEMYDLSCVSTGTDAPASLLERTEKTQSTSLLADEIIRTYAELEVQIVK